ncbi:16S rRNA (guanine(966)-N(2))-methyltransferase RsmD [Acidihalobacter ferrooxydans]|uniref:Ribosomal RNA small subunit methyltransferase D n=1 Tax=Acidihalobacter ferrooxydans TaxID=1765967 RepID=A0A1P8UKE6_9GAMM|nr:16S rRNA (guanine(966)-N(2))-methyltransferase RsmD [Acidihalobacter ferrooxydans]APZ44308.1 16S rRNA (guanine(966)-N(2))-methyltransferase RsmD [Acidihalobacter ferrooxydans]
MTRGRGTRRPAATNQLRIIGGDWRGRRLRFPDAEGLRPTGDRVRETLFNWLQGRVYGRRCLDVFAGSGALGFEAASRGAAQVVMVEAAPRVAEALRANAALLGATAVQVEAQRAEAFLQTAPQAFDLIFLDPPFGKALLEPTLCALAAGGWCAPDARLYLECEATLGDPTLPRGYSCVKRGRAGQTAYFLVARDAVPAA